MSSVPAQFIVHILFTVVTTTVRPAERGIAELLFALRLKIQLFPRACDQLALVDQFDCSWSSPLSPLRLLLVSIFSEVCC